MTRRKVARGVAIPDAALDGLIDQARSPEELEALFRVMKQRVVERMLQGELSAHLGYAPGRRSRPDRRTIGMARHRKRC